MPGQVEQSIARLRFTLAQIKAKQKDDRSLEGQYEAQLRRVPQHVLYGPTSIDAALGMMMEVEERLLHVRVLLRHLDTLEARVLRELNALLVTTQIERARTELAAFEARLEAGPSLTPEEEEEMRRLREFIVETSRHAGEEITGRSG